MNKIGRKNNQLNFEFGSSNFFCEDCEIKFKTSFFGHFHSHFRCQWRWQDLNRRPWDGESSVLPLYYCCLPVKFQVDWHANMHKIIEIAFDIVKTLKQQKLKLQKLKLQKLKLQKLKTEMPI